MYALLLGLFGGTFGSQFGVVLLALWLAVHHLQSQQLGHGATPAGLRRIFLYHLHLATQSGGSFLTCGAPTAAQRCAWGYHSYRLAVGIGLHQSIGQHVLHLIYIYRQTVGAGHIVAILQPIAAESLGKGPHT